MACIRKVALPVDGSEHSERACDCTYFKEISDFFFFAIGVLSSIKLAFVRVRDGLHAGHRNNVEWKIFEFVE